MRLFGSTLISSLILSACTGENIIEKQENSAPTVLIVSHSDGVEVQDGYVEAFRATVSDDDNEFTELSVAWYVGEELVCDWEIATPSGESNCDVVFSEGDSNLIVEVRDPQGTGGRDEISVSVLPTEAPVVALMNPIVGGSYYSDQLIHFWAVVSDEEDLVQDLLVTWTSSLDDELSVDTSVDSSGDISDYGYLSEGQHAIEVRVEDSSGKLTTEEVVIQVGGANSLPGCFITDPLDGASFVIGEAIQFRGSASDVDIPSDQLSVEWISDKDGTFGNSTPSSSGNISFATSALSSDIHTITMRVLDEVGASCSEQIVVSVGTPPTVMIETPLDGDVYSVGEAIPFRGIVSDQEDLMNQIAVTWVSSLEGELLAGSANSQGISQWSSTSLGAGLHSLTLSATDSGGLSSDDVITFRVNTPPVVSSLSLSPDPVYGDDSLTAVALSSDVDGDPVSLSYQWLENGVLTGFTGTMIASSELEAGELWTVRVTADDGYIAGTYSELSIEVSNSLPQVSAVLISPSGTVYNDSLLTCSGSVFDHDEVLTPSYSWSVGGSAYLGSTLDLSNVSVLPMESVVCIVSVVDSQGEAASGSTSILLDNRAPVIASVSVTSSGLGGQAFSDSVLTCAVSSSDLDGETVSDAFSWWHSGTQVGTGNSLTLTSSIVAPLDSVECMVNSVDGFGGISTDSVSVTVQNRDPVIDSFTLTPTEPNVSDVLLCEAIVSDLEDSAPNVSFSFSNLSTGASYVSSATTADSASLDLSGVSVNAGEEVECAIVVTDLHSGTVSSAEMVLIINTAPVLSNLLITPNAGVEDGTDLICSATAIDYNDGDLTSQISYQWTVNGLPIANFDTYQASASDANVWDMITCTASVMDSDLETTNASTSVQFDNTTPTLNGIQITGGTGSYYNDEVLVCSATLFDPNEVLLPFYSWTSGSQVLGTSDSLDLLATALLPSDLLTCSISASDSQGSSVQDSITVSIGDRAPETPTVNITWSSGASAPDETENLLCSASGGVDPDGESYSYSYSWTSSLGASAIGDIVYSSQTQSSETWICEVSVTAGALSTTGSSSVTIDSDWTGEREFSTCGQTGLSGPSQSQCTSAYSGTALDGEVTVSSGIQSWIVPSNGTYQIEVWGARGGHKPDGLNAIGGSGAMVSGEFQLTQGDEIQIIVGQMGSEPSGANSSGGSGGGGGTFVFYDVNDSLPLIVAGGGGGLGAGNGARANGLPGLIGTGGGDSSVSEGLGGQNGYGGLTSTASYNSGGGAGWLSNGEDGSDPEFTGGGEAPRNGGLGGVRGRISYSADGGFGGGAGTNDGGGGGGGYSGGGGGRWWGGYPTPGGGGGSYNAGTNQVGTSAYNSDYGRVFIDKL